MHSAPHRNNSDFQLKYFIAGGCHTADAAWNILYEQKLDIQLKMESTRAKILRRKANYIKLTHQLENAQNEHDALICEANLIEHTASDNLLELALEGAKKELKTIEHLMEELGPHRKYAHLPLLEATELAQQDEWREEFKHRIENFLISTGTIPADQLESMRKHPDFETHILPHMKKTMQAIEGCNTFGASVNLLTRTTLLLEGAKNGQET